MHLTCFGARQECRQFTGKGITRCKGGIPQTHHQRSEASGGQLVHQRQANRADRQLGYALNEEQYCLAGDDGSLP